MSALTSKHLDALRATNIPELAHGVTIAEMRALDELDEVVELLLRITPEHVATLRRVTDHMPLAMNAGDRSDCHRLHDLFDVLGTLFPPPRPEAP